MQTPHFLTPKTQPFLRGREILDPRDFADYLHPNHNPETESGPASFASLQPIADSALAYHPETYHIPGFPANPRMLLSRLYLQLGVFIDYYTGAHEDGGISRTLRDASILNSQSRSQDDDALWLERVRALVPQRHQRLFPQLGVSAQWPPTMLVHGTEDSAVPVSESRSLGQRLQTAGVEVKILEVKGKEHSFDYELGAEELFTDVFDAVSVFLARHIGGAQSKAYEKA